MSPGTLCSDADYSSMLVDVVVVLLCRERRVEDLRRRYCLGECESLDPKELLVFYSLWCVD